MQNNASKRIILVALIISFLFSMIGCSNKANNKIKEARYSEEEINFTDISRIYDMKYVDDKIKILGSDFNNKLIYKDYEDENSHDNNVDDDLIKDIPKGYSFVNGVFSKQGDICVMFVAIMM